jgi:hypothetical protein
MRLKLDRVVVDVVNSGSLQRDLFFNEDHKISRGEQSQLLRNIMKVMRQLAFSFLGMISTIRQKGQNKERRVSVCN